MQPTKSNLPSAFGPATLFLRHATKVAIFYSDPRENVPSFEPSFGKPILMLNVAYAGCYLKNHQDDGLLLGCVNNKHIFIDASTVSGVRIKSPTLLSLTAKNRQFDIIYKPENPYIAKVACLAMVKDGVIDPHPRSDLLAAKHEFLLIKKGAEFGWHPLPKNQNIPSAEELGVRFPASIIIIDHVNRRLATITPKEDLTLDPIVTLDAERFR